MKRTARAVPVCNAKETHSEEANTRKAKMKGVEMTRGLLALAVAALAVMCLGMITITSQRTELLVGSFVPRKDKLGHTPSAPHGYGARLSVYRCLCMWAAALRVLLGEAVCSVKALKMMAWFPLC